MALTLFTPSSMVSFPRVANYGGTGLSQSNAVADAATEKIAMSGFVFIEGRPTSAKTISAAGGGAIRFKTHTSGHVWSDAGTSVDIGIQDATLTAGPPTQPDGTFDVYKTIIGTTSMPGSTWTNFSLSGGTGSKNITHGDLISVVWDMTARGGTDALSLSFGTGVAAWPATTNHYTSGAWLTAITSTFAPNVMLVFDDGSLGYLACGDTLPCSAVAAQGWTSSSTPDEMGNVFVSPVEIQVDAFDFFGGATATTGDLEVRLYSDPLGTPTLLESVAIDGNTMGAVFQSRNIVWPFNNGPITLSANTSYGVTIRATGAGNARVERITFGDSDVQSLYPGNVRGITAVDGGSFTEQTAYCHSIGVRVSHIHDGVGGGGGMRVIGS